MGIAPPSGAGPSHRVQRQVTGSSLGAQGQKIPEIYATPEAREA